MLKYSVRLTDKDIKNNVLQWREKYLAPDLSYISGVTDVSSHIERFNELSAHNSLSNQGSILSLETEIVTRLGYIVIKDKEYKVESVNGKQYVFINGKYFYENNNKITITDWQCETIDGIVEKSVVKSIENGDIIKLDTVCWIENGLVKIDGVKYIFDKNEQQEDGTIGCLKAAEDGSIINETDITKCSSIYYAPYTSVKQIHDVCKFKLTKPTYKTIEYNYVKPCEYFFYVDYKNNYYPIRVNGNAKVVCEINSDDIDVLSTDLNDSESEAGQPIIIGDDIKDLNDLVNIASYVKIDGVQYNTQYDYRVSHSSRLIMIDIKDQYSNLNIGDKITFEDVSEDELNVTVSSADTSILYDGKKYPIKANLVSKAEIDGNEYDIEYPKYSTEFAYVIIDGEQIPMELISGGTHLSRYGLVVSSSNSAATQETYSISGYSGVTIDGKDYMIKDINTSGLSMVVIEKKERIRFIIDDIKGNSLLICEPYINANEYSSTEIENRQNELCDKIVSEQTDYSLQLPNPIFGLMPITNDLAFMVTDTPKSSDDYYNLFNDLVIETNSGYINLPINISANITNNLLQSELIQEDFCEKEKEKAINPIVDLEKDVYTPKYLKSNKYDGKDTDFYPVYKINFNLHFRTRDLTSWKVNESYNDISTSGTCNWFITDYYPYKTIIKNYSDNTAYMNTLMNASDLVGLLYFNNSDVFYQKSNIAKSFIRLSIYDSTDPQTQSLLATSTIFMNEHDLYKKFIDNSKKNVNEYYTVAESSGDCKTINKINVIGERKTVKGDKGENVIEDERNKLYLDLDNNKRLSSRLSVVNKYETDSSSEGFYLYIFREYSKKLRPKPIYMKVEFNHAGIGKTIPFIVPMKWTEKNSNNEVYPERAYTLADVEELKKGIELERVYAQSYVPLYAVYDFKNKEYVYVFDDRYISMENGIVNLNLFEMKIMEETGSGTTSTSIIDINEQFRTDEDNS